MTYKNYLVLSRLHVINANAQSSPISIGVPAVSAFLGATHKLQRIINRKGYESVRISGTGIIIHDTRLHSFIGRNGHESFTLEGKPLKKDGERQSTIPDPKIDLSISLICEVEDSDDLIIYEDDFISVVDEALRNEIRIAGGDILPQRGKDGKVLSSLRVYYYQGKRSNQIKEVIHGLIPGYALIGRRDLLINKENEGADTMNAFIDYLAIHHECKKDENEKIVWGKRRKTSGWIVPISVGYQGISQVEVVNNQRDQNYPHIFGENLVTLGEFRMISSFEGLDEIMWRYNTNFETLIFECVNGGK